MPHKNQTQSYRTINGVKWWNQFDVISAEYEALLARITTLKLRKRVVRIDDFKRVFVHPADIGKVISASIELADAMQKIEILDSLTTG